MPLKERGVGIDARAEIQDILFGIFALSLSIASMNLAFGKVNHNKKSFFSRNTWIDCLKIVV
jgi:hypothetical protein